MTNTQNPSDEKKVWLSDQDPEKDAPFVLVPLAAWMRLQTRRHALEDASRRYMTEVASAALAITDGVSAEGSQGAAPSVRSLIAKETARIARATISFDEALKAHDDKHG